MKWDVRVAYPGRRSSVPGLFSLRTIPPFVISEKKELIILRRYGDRFAVLPGDVHKREVPGGRRS